MTEQQTLVEFIEARMADDENAARQAVAEQNDNTADWTEVCSGTVGLGERGDLIATGDAGVSRHIALHDPARVLREVAAKRAIIAQRDAVQQMLLEASADPAKQDNVGVFANIALELDKTLNHLAAVYSDHEAYRKEWRP